MDQRYGSDECAVANCERDWLLLLLLLAKCSTTAGQVDLGLAGEMLLERVIDYISAPFE